MDSLFHFIFAFIAGLAVGLHKKHSIRTIALISFSAVLIDLDHFLPFYPGIKAFHNVFIAILMPIAFFLAAFYYEKGKSIKLQSYALILLVMLTGHLVSDLFSGAQNIFYPVSKAKYNLPGHLVRIELGSVITGEGLALLAYALILLSAKFVEDFIYFFERKHETLRKALKDVVSEI